MRYRKLSKEYVNSQGRLVKAGDMEFGQSLANFHIDTPEAPAQAVLTRLRLQTGDWFLDLREGTPWKTEVLGKHTSATRDIVLQYRVAGTMAVREIVDYNSSVDRDTRAFGVQITIDTIYGQTVVEGPL